jgi:hypothetical protein
MQFPRRARRESGQRVASPASKELKANRLMPIHRPRLSARLLGPLLLGAAAALFTLGCQQNEDIQHYQAPHIETPMIRLRVAIFKFGNKTWFFKLRGAKDVVDQHANEFEDFLRSVKPDEMDKDKVVWKAPDGWVKEPAGDQRYAAYLIGPKDTAAELTVVPLGDQAGSLLDNVNRWRDQLGLRAINEEALDDDVRKEQIGDQKVTRVELTAAGRLRKTPAPALSIDKNLAEAGIQYEAPEGWKKMPQAPEFAVAGFHVHQGTEDAVVSVSPLPPQPLLTNVIRWRQQVGLGAIDSEQVKDIVRPFDVGGAQAQALDMAGKKSRILVVLLPHGGKTWIFKMMGSPDLVGKQKPDFEKFVRSVRFDGGNDE